MWVLIFLPQNWQWFPHPYLLQCFTDTKKKIILISKLESKLPWLWLCPVLQLHLQVIIPSEHRSWAFLKCPRLRKKCTQSHTSEMLRWLLVNFDLDTVLVCYGIAWMIVDVLITGAQRSLMSNLKSWKQLWTNCEVGPLASDSSALILLRTGIALKNVPKAWRLKQNIKTLCNFHIIFIHQNPSSLGVTGKGRLSGTPGSSGTKPELINSSGFSLLGTIGFSLLVTMGTIAIKSILSTNKLQVVKQINYPSQRYWPIVRLVDWWVIGVPHR